jgi:hypothetical protein
MAEDERKPPLSAHISCLMHPIMTLKLNMVISLLVANLGALWVGFYFEIKPVMLKLTAQETKLTGVDIKVDHLQARMEQHNDATLKERNIKNGHN